MKKFRIERMPKMFRKGSGIFIFSMLIISILWFFIFYVAVNLNSIVMAFKTLKGIDEHGQKVFEFSFNNFRQLFMEIDTPDSNVRVSIHNTLKYFGLNFFIIIPITYFVSYFLYKKIYGYKFFRVLFYMPSILSSVTMVIIFKNMVGSGGPIDTLLKLFGTQLPPLLTNPEYATNTILVYCLWTGFGVNIILYQGAFQRIPDEIIDAGKIDGVPWFKELIFIITPMVWSTLSMTLILAFTGLFTSTGPILLFGTNGAYETFTINYYIFSQVYDSGVFNYPAAVGLFFTVYSLPIILGFRYIMTVLDPKVEY